MTYGEIIQDLRADIDDDISINQAFSPLALARFITRAERIINNRLKVSKKETYIFLEENIDIYPMPVDYIGFETCFDIRNQRALEHDDQLNALTKIIGYPMNMETDETNRKFRFDAIPDANCKVSGLSITGTTSAIIKMTTPVANFFQPTVVKIVSGSDTEYVRISRYSEDIDNNVLSLYISERDIYGTGQITLAAGQTITFANYIIEYIFNPANCWEQGAGTISSNGTAVTGVGSSFTSYVAGDSIIVDEILHGDISSIATDTGLTLVDAFMSNVSGRKYYIVNNSRLCSLPVEIQHLLPVCAKALAFENKSLNESANQQWVKFTDMLLEAEAQEVREFADKYNQNQRGYVWPRS